VQRRHGREATATIGHIRTHVNQQARYLLVTFAFVAIITASCGVLSRPDPTGSPLTNPELRYKLVEQFGRPAYCDPAEPPGGRLDDPSVAVQRFPEIERDPTALRVIAAHLGLPENGPYTDEQKLRIYREWRLLSAITLTPADSGFRFQLRVSAADNSKDGVMVEGTIDGSGRITVARRSRVGPLDCPICLSQETFIDTPGGELHVTELRPGMIVWTLGASGAREAAPLLQVASIRAPAGHELIRVVLADGRVVTASPGHPTADGRMLGEFVQGAMLDGALVRQVSRLPYRGSTYDLLPAGPTGVYWADGVALASTLTPSRTQKP
jgi:hypothetical protein